MRTVTAPSILAHLPVRRGRSGPLHKQIYDGMRRAILDGLLRPGQRIPSTRALAEDLGVSRLSVLTAFDQLRHEGYIVGRTGAGTFVSDALPDDRLQVSSGLRAPRSRVKTPTPPVAVAGDPWTMRPFRINVPALDKFPHSAWARIVARRAHAIKPKHLGYTHPAGLLELREAVAEHLRTARAVRCEAAQVLIVSGSQLALQLCARVLLGRGDVVAIEEPGYPGAHLAFETTGVDLAPVRVDDEGIDVAALDAVGRRVRAVYVTPSHQYPLGTSMSAARRMELLDWATKRNAWLIEDDYDSEFRYVSRPLAALQGMSVGGQVVYIGTFSKVLFPALRVGYVVVPPAQWDAFIEARDAIDICSPTLLQLALADFINEGHFARHIRRMRLVYEERRDALLEGLATHCEGLLTVHNADAGLQIAAFLPPGVSDVDVLARMDKRSLMATRLSTSYLGTKRKQGLLLGFGGWDERRIAAASRTLGEVLESLLSNDRR
jgi:GntR family transcriptional regulator/MocR family aminotransferase